MHVVSDADEVHTQVGMSVYNYKSEGEFTILKKMGGR